MRTIKQLVNNLPGLTEDQRIGFETWANGWDDGIPWVDGEYDHPLLVAIHSLGATDNDNREAVKALLELYLIFREQIARSELQEAIQNLHDKAHGVEQVRQAQAFLTGQQYERIMPYSLLWTEGEPVPELIRAQQEWEAKRQLIEELVPGWEQMVTGEQWQEIMAALDKKMKQAKAL